LLVFVAVYYSTNEFDVITSNLLQIKILGQTAKIMSTIFNDKILLLIMVLLSAFLFWIKEAQKVGADLYKKGLISPCDPIR